MDLSERPAADRGPRHPWEQARARFFVRLVRRLLPRGGHVVDIGAGDAFLARQLVDALADVDVVAWDQAYWADEAQAIGAARLTAVRQRPADASFDLALLLDVLEHVDDDLALLDSAARLVRAGGRLVVSVPAWPQLFSSHDMRLRHRRRYTPAELDALVARAGLAVVERCGMFSSLLPVRALSAAFEARTGQSVRPPGGDVGGDALGAAIGTAIGAALDVDLAVNRTAGRLGVALPGLSYCAVVAHR